MATIIEVARALRSEINHAEAIIPTFCINAIGDASPQTILGFIDKAFDHQERIADKDSKFFAATIVEVKTLTRKTGDRELGKKGVIVLESTNKKGDAQEETINTHWIEFLGQTDPAKVEDGDIAWEMAMSQSIMEDCEGLIGQKVSIRKAFVEAETSQGGDRVRFIADVVGGRRDARDDNGNSKSNSKKSSSSDTLSVSDIKDICEDMRVKYAKDLDDLLDVKDWTGSDEDVAERVAKAARFRGRDLDDFVDEFLGIKKGTVQEKAVITLAGWL